MNVSRRLNSVLSIWKSIDFRLLYGSFIASVLILHSLNSTSQQIVALAAILIVVLGISVLFKRRRNWTRGEVGLKGAIAAVGVALFVAYAMCNFSISFASWRGIELDGSLKSQVATGLSDPWIFANVMPFLHFGIFGVAANLGLTDSREMAKGD